MGVGQVIGYIGAILAVLGVVWVDFQIRAGVKEAVKEVKEHQHWYDGELQRLRERCAKLERERFEK